MSTQRTLSKVLSVATSFLAVGAVMLIGKANDVSAATDSSTLSHSIQDDDVQLGYLEIGDVDNGGGNPSTDTLSLTQSGLS